MIKIENVVLPSADQWNAIIMGARNPLNSWHKSDSHEVTVSDYLENMTPWELNNSYIVGPNDWNLMRKLARGGADDRKFMRMIVVYLDITAPLYWWKEFDTYKVGTVANSCSTMHKIHEKEFTLEDFSCEHITNDEFLFITKNETRSGDIPHQLLCRTIDCLNGAREKYLQTKDKKYWWQMIQLLPSSYNQKRTVMLNYEVLRNMYHARINHKLDCWHIFCDWIETLPYSELITNDMAKNS